MQLIIKVLSVGYTKKYATCALHLAFCALTVNWVSGRDIKSIPVVIPIFKILELPLVFGIPVTF